MAKKNTTIDEPSSGIQYNMTQAAKILGVGRVTVRNMTEDGRLKAGKTDNGRYFYTAEDLLTAKQKMTTEAGGLTEYDLVQAVDGDDLVRAVNAKMLEGWDLAGGVAMCVLANGIYYAQAISRKKPL